MKQTLNYPLRISFIIIFFSSCTSDTNSYATKKIMIFKNIVSMNIPTTWAIMNDSLGFHDDILLENIYIGKDDKNGCTGNLKKVKYPIPLSKYLKGAELEIKAKNPFAVVVNKFYDINKNIIQIEYEYSFKNSNYYGVFVVYFYEDKQIQFIFNTEANTVNREQIKNIVKSIMLIK